MVDDLKNRRNKVEKTINNFRKKLEKNKNKTKKIRSEIRYYST